MIDLSPGRLFHLLVVPAGRSPALKFAPSKKTFDDVRRRREALPLFKKGAGLTKCQIQVTLFADDTVLLAEAVHLNERDGEYS